MKSKIYFYKIFFFYLGNDNLVFKNVDIFLFRGKILVLVGGLGVGKLIFVDLLLRFYDFIFGCIIIDGIDLCEFDIISLRKKIGIVS